MGRWRLVVPGFYDKGGERATLRRTKSGRQPLRLPRKVKGGTMAEQLYHLANIRELLLKGFDDRDLRQLSLREATMPDGTVHE
jgi:hypothetical protein